MSRQGNRKAKDRPADADIAWCDGKRRKFLPGYLDVLRLLSTGTRRERQRARAIHDHLLLPFLKTPVSKMPWLLIADRMRCILAQGPLSGITPEFYRVTLDLRAAIRRDRVFESTAGPPDPPLKRFRRPLRETGAPGSAHQGRKSLQSTSAKYASCSPAQSEFSRNAFVRPGGAP